MAMKNLMKPVMAVAAFALCAGHAQAATFTLNLTGVVADGVFFHFNSGGTHYDQWLLPLMGLDSSNQITVSQGDTINATVTLDQLFTVPASQQLTSFSFLTTGSSFPAINTGVSGATTFFNGITPIKGGSGSTTTSSQLANDVGFFPSNNTAFTFDSVTSNFTIDTLGQPATLDRASISYTLFSRAVPEPASWAMLLIGFSGLGAAMRSRRKLAVARA